MRTTAAELKVIERIKKLHAMAESARDVGNLAEAESFMEGVAKTLAAHNMESSVLSMDLREMTDPLGQTGTAGATFRGKDKPQQWAMNLGVAVAEAHFAVMHYSVNSSWVFFYGRTSNIETARQMFVYLRDMAEREGKKAWSRQAKQYGRVKGRTDIGWYLAYLEGFAVEVGKRYRLMRARVESDTGMAVVLSGARTEATEWSLKNQATDLDALKKLEKPITRGGFHSDAANAGAEKARTANLRPNVATEAPKRKGLGA